MKRLFLVLLLFSIPAPVLAQQGRTGINGFEFVAPMQIAVGRDNNFLVDRTDPNQTEAYVASVPIFTVWCLSISMAAFQTDGVLRVFAEMRYLIGANVVRLILLVVTMGWFLSKFHLMGAVLITLIGMLLAKTIALARVTAVLETRLADLLPWKNIAGTLAASMGAAIPVAFLNAKLSLPAVVLLSVSGMTYAVTYGALVLIFGLLGKEEIDALKRALYVWNRGSVQSARQASIGR